uniref:Fibrinogen C-terminal domain-containing protein n=1 Tax=Magallana gigas TaxID=29159 RepID=A0A8W8MEU2_MAGGI
MPGNDKLHNLLSQGTYEMRMDMEDFDNRTRYVKYSSFNSNKQNITEVEDGPGRVFDGGPSVANSVLVFGANGLVDKDSVDSSAGNSIPPAFEGETSTTQETNSNSVSLIMENLEIRKISRTALDIIMASWRPATYIGQGNNEDDLVSGEYQFVFSSPESILSVTKWRDLLTSPAYKNLELFVVDEAHTVLQW